MFTDGYQSASKSKSLLKSFKWNQMDLDALPSTSMPSPPQRPVVTLTFDLQNLIKSSVGANEYSLQVHGDCSNRSWDIVVARSIRTDERGRRTARKRSPTLSGNEGMNTLLRNKNQSSRPMTCWWKDASAQLRYVVWRNWLGVVLATERPRLHLAVMASLSCVAVLRNLFPSLMPMTYVPETGTRFWCQIEHVLFNTGIW